MPTDPTLGLNLPEAGSNAIPAVSAFLQTVAAVQASPLLQNGLATPPGSPSNGDLYIVGTSATGAWTGQDGNLAFYLDGWTFIAPRGGMQLYDANAKELICYSSVESLWFPVQKRWSTTEHWTGEYRATTGGGTVRKVYSKVVEFGALPNTTTKNVAHGISNLAYDVPVSYQASAGLNDNQHFPMPVVTTSATCTLFITETNIQCQSTANFSSYSMNIRLEYCKDA